ncbi:MAG: uroporphyrinogen-III C-methyltransferase [Gammaproteobacteria bacterium]|nr:uroporphyrinogen-III C-methyltransferase [Gammaproteobacteria bacterium]
MNQTTPRSSRVARFALAIGLVALGGGVAQWLGLGSDAVSGRTRSEDLARTQRQLNALEDRIQSQRSELQRLAEKLGVESRAEGTLGGRVTQLEQAVARLHGGEGARLRWHIDQAEHFLRIANAQETLAGDSSGALAALELADQQLREAADPRLSTVRRLLADEIRALRALPRVDTEGLALKLATLAAELPRLPRRQAAPGEFRPALQPAAEASDGISRALAVLRNAFFGIVSVRRTAEPAATLLTADEASLLERSLDLELQLARLALVNGEAQAFRASVAATKALVERHFDTAAPAGAAALATLDELAGVAMPESLPDVSASLAELLRVKEREGRP